MPIARARWFFGSLSGDTLAPPEIGIEMPVEAIFEGVEFGTAEDGPASGRRVGAAGEAGAGAKRLGTPLGLTIS